MSIRYASEVSTSSTDGRGFVYEGWRSGKNTRHFRGTVTPL